MNNNFTTDVEMNVRTCPVCGVVYAISEEFKDRKLNYNEDWYCPNGHNLVFTDPPAKKLKEENKKLKNERDNWKNRMYHFKEEAEHKEYQRRGHKAAHTRLKNAVSNGQCPCCGEHFEDLENHMNSQHPDFKVKENTHE